MKAILLKDSGSVDQLYYDSIEKPVAKENEVLVEVKAISINPVDIKTRNGKAQWQRIKEFSPIILGWDVSGVVTLSNSAQFKAGDEVFGMVNFPGYGKAYAEFVVAPAAHLSLKPASVPHDQAAAATLAALTALQALRKAGVRAGQRVLIHASAGGVGHYAVQLAKHFGAYVIGTSSAVNKEFVLSLGADEHLDYTTTVFENVLSELDFVFDCVGGDMSMRSLSIIKKGGALISIVGGITDAVLAAAAKDSIHAQPLMVESSGDDMKYIASLLGSGTLKSHIGNLFQFGEIKNAHLQIETARTVGKVIIQL